MRRRLLTVVAFTLVCLLTPACLSARAGARCATKQAGQDATHVLACKNGRWVRLISKADGLKLLAEVRARNQATTIPPPTAPAATAPAPTTTAPTTTAPAPTTTAPPLPAYAISASYQQTCAVTVGVVRCLGANGFGQLGNNSTTPSDSFVLTGLSDVVATSGGGAFGCALESNGTVWCWGAGNGGYLGDGLNAASLVPVQVSGITDATQIASGSAGSCARTASGLVRCWGAASLRGDGGSGGMTTPVTVSLSGVAKVSVGGAHACAVKADGAVWCWGANAEGQLGIGTTGAPTSTPVQAVGVTTAVDVAAGGFDGASCAVLASGAVQCWGDDSHRQLGDGDLSPVDRPTPTIVPGLSNATRIAMGFYTTCAIRTTGEVACWGSGGLLGDATNLPSSSPVAVFAVIGALTISGQGTHMCALQTGNTAACWGENNVAQLGGGGSATVNYAAAVIGMP